MPIKRAQSDSGYSIIDNHGIKNKNLSAKAKGVLVYMLSLPDDWIFYEKELEQHFTDGKSSIRSALKELEEQKYLVRTKKREQGKFSGYDWVIYDKPCHDNILTESDFPKTVFPKTDNQQLLSTNQYKELKEQNTKPVHSAKAEQIPYKEIVEYLNSKTNKRFNYKSNKTRDLIKARHNEGYLVNDFKKVIDHKCKEWLNNDTMNKYLRPATLFSNKFDNYINEVPKERKEKSSAKKEKKESLLDNLF